MQRLFKNVSLINIESGEVSECDFLVENGVISKIGKIENFKGEEIDLEGNYVLPNFVNLYANAFKAFEENYPELELKKSCENDVKRLLFVKNILSGAFCNDISEKNSLNSVLLEDIVEKSDYELSKISDDVAKSKAKLFIKVGQTLDELGKIDKTYQKSLSEVLEDFGFLDRKSVLVGVNCFEKDELQLFSQYDCDICLTASEDGRVGRRPTNLLALKTLNFCVGIGSGNSFEIDFFGFMRQILLTQRGLFEDKNCLSEQEVLKMATVNGSKILTGQENRIEEGKIANFIVVKKRISLYQDIFKILVWEMSKRDVLMTVCKGEILQKNGEILMQNMPNCDTIICRIKQQGER